MNARLVCLLAWLFGATAYAQPIALESLPSVLEPSVELLVDPSGALDLEQASRAHFQQQRGELSFGFDYAAVWVRFQVRNHGPQPVRWMLSVDEPSLDHADLYVRHGHGPLEVHRDGDALPFSQRERGSALPLFSLTSEPGDEATCYLRVQSEDVLRMPIRLWQPAAYAAHHERESLLQWVAYGALLMLALYNLGVFVTVGHAEHFFSVLAALSMTLVLASLNGHQAQFLFPDQPGLCARLPTVAMSLAALMIALFTNAVIRRLAHRQAVERYFVLAVYGTAMLTLFCVLAPIGLCFRVIAVVMFLLGVTGPWMLYKLGAYPLPEIALYRRSWIPLCIALPLTVLRYQGWLPAWDWMVWALPFAFVAQGVTSSLALASLAGAMQRALTVMNEQLQKNVDELQQAVTRAEQANEASLRATKAKDEFVATMSHELRTPLNAIINIPQGLIHEFVSVRSAKCSHCSSSYLLDEGDDITAQSACTSCGQLGTLVEGRRTKFRGDDARYLRFLQKIERSGQHLLQMINGVLDYSKLEAARFELALEPVDLDALIREVCDQMIDIAQRKGVQLELDYTAPSKRTMLADVLRLKQVLINLFANAIKFSEPGTTVSLRWASQHEGEIIEVEDRGIGIAPEHHERIFTSFEQVHQGDTRKYGGTGLGLSISRSLVRMHGGELSVRSELGKGSTFVVRLPRITTLAGHSVEMPLPENLNAFDSRPRASSS